MKRHIFLVDEDKNELSRFMAAINNIKEPLKCTYCSNGQQAVEMLKYLVPDFIFIGDQLPKIDVLQILPFARTLPRLKSSKVYIISDNVNDEISRKVSLLGASGFLARHGTVSWLTNQLRTILSVPFYQTMHN